MILLYNTGPSTDVWTLSGSCPSLLPLHEPGSLRDDQPFWTTALFHQQLLLWDLTRRFSEKAFTPARDILIHTLTKSFMFFL